jgi:hypothetical protein
MQNEPPIGYEYIDICTVHVISELNFWRNACFRARGNVAICTRQDYQACTRRASASAANRTIVNEFRETWIYRSFLSKYQIIQLFLTGLHCTRLEDVNAVCPAVCMQPGRFITTPCWLSLTWQKCSWQARGTVNFCNRIYHQRLYFLQKIRLLAFYIWSTMNGGWQLRMHGPTDCWFRSLRWVLMRVPPTANSLIQMQSWASTFGPARLFVKA